jgi:[ribosomal protein S5]-alanine N-acetyltransferase
VPELPVPSLADDVVLLRPWREADVPAQLAAFSDPFFLRFSDWAPQTEADALAYLAGHEQARHRGEQIELALVEPHDESVLLGGGSLNNVDLPEGRAAVGYWLAPHARGRGVATHAVRLIAGWAFRDLRVARLELTCGPDNGASQRVAERCGFTREGVLRAHVPFKGARRDSVVFSLLAGELR